jgi:sulfur carrier protein ThiS adenylyltransferase
MNDRFLRQHELVPQEALTGTPVTVIGVGAIGRQVALMLAAIGVRDMTLIDFDQVDETNLTTQSYRHRDIGQPKVLAAKAAALEIDPTITIAAIEDRFKPSQLEGQAAFCAVDSIGARKTIWRQVGHRVRFWSDGRMQGEVIRMLSVAEFHGREHYPTTLFDPAEAQTGSCTSKSTIYAASIAAGLMVHQFSRWLRGLPTDSDVSLNLLSGEMATA